MNDTIIRVFQYPDKPHHVTLVVVIPDPDGPWRRRQFDVPIDSPMGQHYKEQIK